ncbi:P-loop containing nucleoside triphosphate hydrolase protein [Podospora australis]|uniref:P-loop containing nucleoside triphosphate hydrolase protein n=1 Tax=Podospora australis TaxID=1536484 RepID=A0AAN6X4S3_9PEZI|nr:P-loop containing nucleoside triphosphate hydrolase protein [Podospora australis]
MKRFFRTALRFKESPKDPRQIFRKWPQRAFSDSARRPAEAAPIRLRNYQEECIQSILASIENGHKRLGVSLATGSGKTVIFTRLIDRVKPLSETATQTLILAHRRELVEQAARHCTNAYPDKTVELELGKLTATGTADITVASVQSITSKDRLLKFDPSRFKLVLVDEAHHIVAPNYLRVLKHLKLGSKQADSPNLVGVSATLSRTDGLRLGAAIDEIVYHKDYVDMIGEKWLSDVVFTTVESHADLSKVKRKGVGGTGEFDTASLSRAVNTVELNDVIVRSWMAKAVGRTSTLVFCVDINHVVAVTNRFRHYGIEARFVTGDTAVKERAEILDGFKKKEFPVLVNCGVFTEGTDIPNIDCVILARPTRSRNLLIQMIGRGMRLHEGKENCHIIDMVASLETGIVTTPTLFGLDPHELVKESSGEELYKLRERREAERKAREEMALNKVATTLGAAPSTGHSYQVAFTEYDSVFELISDTSGEKHIRAISQYSWVQISPTRYVLSGQHAYIRLELVPAEAQDLAETTTPEQPKLLYKAFVVNRIPAGIRSKSPWMPPREFLTATDFTDAVHGCDTYVAKHWGQHYILTRAGWRKAAATPGQITFLNRFRKDQPPLKPEDITRGKAADMLTKIKHGARGSFAEWERLKKKQSKLEMHAKLEEERKLREVVSVGPVAN